MRGTLIKTITRSGRGLAALIAIAVIVVALVIRSEEPALAADLTLSPTSGPPGTTVQVTGNGWPAGATVQIMWDRMDQLGQASVTGTGQIAASFSVPAGATAGSHSVVAIVSLISIYGVPTPGPLGTTTGIPSATPPGAITTLPSAAASFTVASAQASPSPSPTATPAVTPAATPTPTASPTPSPSPSPSPSPTPTPTPTPTPSPSPSPSGFAISSLSSGQPCIPVGDQQTCDAQRQQLWNGDREAWVARYAELGRPAPSDDDIFVATYQMRIEAGDPLAIASIARGNNWPHVRITAARYRGTTEQELDEWVEVRNMGGAPQDMSNWSVRIDGSPLRWVFGDGFMLQPGQACKLYTGAPGAEACPGQLASMISPRGVLSNEQGTLSLWVDLLDLKAIEVRYSSRRDQQPPPPNLQGVS